MNLINDNIKQIITLCEMYKVSNLFAFGSILTERFNANSDVDFVVNFKKNEIKDYFDNYFDLKYGLQDLLGREVDLVEEQTIKNPYLKENINTSKILIYNTSVNFTDKLG